MLKELKVTETPVRTSRNFNINNVLFTFVLEIS